jgi:hypothetical protein
MRHEPSGSRPLLQPVADFLAGTPGGCCGSCRHRRAAVTRRCRRRTQQQVARRAEASYRALLAWHRGGDGDAS